MAATTVKPYPHIQMNVKDNSIATINFVETLPVHRPLYVMKTQKGPVGRPVWCNTYSEAAAIFGAETFNPANKDYYTKASVFLRETMTNNGAFISRYLPLDYSSGLPERVLLAQATANTVLYAIVKEAPIPLYKLDKNTGARLQEFKDDTGEWEDVPTGYADIGVSIQYAVEPISNFYVDPTDIDAGLDLSPKPIVGGGWRLPIVAFKAANPGAYGNDLAFQLFYTPKSNDAADVDVYKTLFYNIGFAMREYNSTTWDPVVDIYNRENMAFAANPETINPDTGASMAIDNVLDKGFSDSLHQLPVDFEFCESNLNLIGLIIASYEKDARATMLDPYGEPYDDPYTTKDESAPLYMSLNAYGNGIIGTLTNADKAVIKGWFNQDPYSDVDLTKASDLKENISVPDLGYRVNVISGKNLMNIPYEHVLINSAVNPSIELLPVEEEETYTEDGYWEVDWGKIIGELDDNNVSNKDITVPVGVMLNAISYHALSGGDDGDYIDDEETVIRKIDGVDTKVGSSNDTAMYNFVKLKAPCVRDEIVESLHYPFTHIFDLGYSFKTKKAMLDFLDVRDDVMVILSTQVLMTDGSGRTIKINDQATDEGNGEALRAYALLMRESVLFGTDCMRAAIYCHSGTLTDTTLYSGVLPFTYWDAVQYSKYGNLTYMKQDEPRGLPNSYNLLFKTWNWWNYRADSQSRVWDNGLNYVQYADMTRLFYPSLRTVYRAATSVLVDEWFVAAVVYAKYVCRRAWATFSGRNDTASVLQGMIKKYLDSELAHLFNGKYAFDVSVYQTAEEQELGYIQHVKLSITSGATMRVLDVDIEVNREGFVPEE